MANESLIQVPSNVEEPLVLQRFLLRLVEELDILLGKRGASTDNQYVAQKELIAAGTALAEVIATAEGNLAEATALLEQVLENVSLSLQGDIDAINEEQAVQNTNIDKLTNFSWFRPFTLTFQGRNTNGAATLNLEYNIASGNRTAVGVYEFALTNTARSGVDLLQYTQQLSSFIIADSATSEAYYIKVAVTDVVLGTFTVSVFAVELGAGSKLKYTPYDPLSTDRVSIVGMYTPPGLALP